VSDQSVPEREPAAEVDIDLTAFLPEGVTIDLGPQGADASAAAESPDAGESPVEELPDRAEQQGSDPAAAGGQDAIDLELLDAVEQDLNAVDAALRSLDDGTYGTCAVCRVPIPAEVLAEDPVRRTCVEHA
jgi:RNA polymerase-binding transcription factor DksA